MIPTNDSSALLARFEQHLASTGYTRNVVASHLDCVERFLNHLTQRQISVATVTCADIDDFLQQQRRVFRRRHGHRPVSTGNWRRSHCTAVRKFLQLTIGQWPPTPTPTGPFDTKCRELCAEYARELRDHRNLAACTIYGNIHEARGLLAWVGQQQSEPELAALNVADIDRYLTARVASIQRTTRKTVSLQLRSFLRFLHATGRISIDLAACVISPTLYRFEGVPSILRPEQIRSILTTASKDRSRVGLRNYAMLMLLATYGLRSSEILRLQLKDVDWRGERLWIYHTKTGGRSCLPLMPKVGQALINYLRDSRPECTAREIFVRSAAPRGPFVAATAVNSMLRRHLAKIGIRLEGKRGPHIFRHARAVSLLRSGVPVKTIGDVLGHRSVASTNVYLKLDDHELRAVALEIPTTAVQP